MTSSDAALGGLGVPRPGLAEARGAADDLADRIRRGDVGTMEQVFTAHLDAIYNYCYRRTGSWATAEDLSATVFLEAWRSRRRAAVVDGTLLPWLYGVAANVCRHHLRSHARRRRAEQRLQVLVDVGDDAHLADDVADRAWLREALAELPTGVQDAFVLVCWQDLTYAQAAAALHVPVGTIRSRVHRARKHLQRLHDSTRTARPTEGTDHA